MGATLLDRQAGPLTEADIASAGDTRYLLDTCILNINGGVGVSQELGTTGATLTNNTSKYLADMWEAMYNHTAAIAIVTSGQVAASSFPSVLLGFPNGHQIKATTAISAPANGDFAFHRTQIEGYRTARLGWGASNPSSLSYGFWFYTTASGTITVKISNSAKSRCFYKEHAVVGPGWNWVSATIAGDTSGTWQTTTLAGIIFEIFGSGKAASPVAPDAWSATSTTASTNTTNLYGSNNNLTIVTGLVLIPGTAIPNSLRVFGNQRTFDEELRLCMRYFRSDFPYGTTPADNVQSNKSLGVSVNGGTTVSPIYRFGSSMRASPSVTFYSSNVKASPTAGQWQYFNAAAYVDGSGTTTFSVDTSGFSVSLTTALVSGAGNALVGSWKADARL